MVVVVGGGIMVGRVYYMLFHDLFEPEMCVACVGEVEKGRGGGAGFVLPTAIYIII